MLKSLLIHNIAVIESAEPTFSEGFNTLTGETGAGKSIIVDSINAILGQRTSKDIIRTGCDKAVVVAVFDEVSKAAKALFSKYDIEADQGQYIVQRVLTASGKNTCRVNGVPLNTTALKEIGRGLITIHGQHDNQLLLSPENHGKYLDAFAENEALLSDYKASFDEFRAVRKRLNELVKLQNEAKQNEELLRYQVKELSDADVKPGEVDLLKDRIHVLENAEKIESAYRELCGLVGGDSDASVNTALGEAAAALSKISDVDKTADGLYERILAAQLELSAICADAKDQLEQIGNHREELENLQTRLDNLYTLMRKYGNSEQALLRYLQNASEQLDGFKTNDEEKRLSEQKLLALQGELIQKAAALSDSRKRASKKLSKGITEVLKFLDMPNVQFSVKIDEGSYTAFGTDRVEFLISTNKGQAVMPLHKIASGGELSRIMLAIKSVLADKDPVDTLIFDEIDTGISGRAARKLGIQLKRVSRLRQVLCITHLPQIAALSDYHLLITKQSANDKTYTSVKALSGDDRIREIARMMSGGELTENLYNTAKELIETEAAEFIN